MLIEGTSSSPRISSLFEVRAQQWEDNSRVDREEDMAQECCPEQG